MPPQQQRLQARTPWSSSSSTSTTVPQDKKGSLPPRSENIFRHAIGTTITTKQQNNPLCVNSKEKSSFEVAYKESLAQLALLQQKLHQQALVAQQLERNALEYYYTNAICFGDYDGKRVAQEGSTWHHYYFSSFISQAKRTRFERRSQEERQLDVERHRVERLEEDIRDRIMNGELAERRSAVRGAEEDYSSLQRQLAQKDEEGEACRKGLEEEEEKQQRLQKQRLDAEFRIQQLESERQQLMENTEATHQLIVSKREELEVAEAGLQKKEKVVDDLKETIARLTRKRRQRE